MRIRTGEHEHLSSAERRELLRLARLSILSAVTSTDPPQFRLDTGALLRPGAAFVSLHKEASLRGCVGTIVAEKALRQTVVDMARASACCDPRFSPVTVEELPLLEIEISRLGVLQRADAEDLVVGLHGVSVKRGAANALLLPQVAARYGWTPHELLAEVCLKAGLAADAWRDAQTELRVFTAEVFGEASAGVGRSDEN